MTPLALTARVDGERAVLALVGELDMLSCAQVEEEVARLESERPAVLVLDLSGLRFMDSTGLRIVVGAHTRAAQEERRLVVVRAPDAVQRIFRLTRLDERLEMVDEAPGPGAGGHAVE